VKRISELRITLAVTVSSQLAQLLVTANDVSSSMIVFSPTMETISSFETSVLIRARQRHIPEDAILDMGRNCC
jgi:hypothetical protein